MGPVARDLLDAERGLPREHGCELRYGRRGSMSVDLDRGAWFDHEAGVGGGVIALVEHLRGCGRADALGCPPRRGGRDRRARDRSLLPGFGLRGGVVRWFGRSPPRGGDSRGWGLWWASGRDAWFGVRSGAGVPRAGVLVPSCSTTTIATGGSPARRRGRTGLPRSLGRIPRIGTCGTRTRMAWCASSRPEGRSPFSHLGPRSFLTMHYPDRPRQIDAVSNGRAAPGQREATDGPRKSGKRS